MPKLSLQVEVTLDVRDCPACGVKYAITDEFLRWRHEDHQNFYCPNGHAWHYPAKTRADVLQEQLDAERARLRQIEHERDLEKTRAAQAEAHLREAKANATRVARRTAAGVCTCCHRTFKQLAAHMKNKHPEVKA